MAEAQTKKPTSLPKEVFSVDVPNHDLLKLAYESYLANDRQASATTKQRGEVRGGGKKPWRQKGTGRARFGSSRNPIWRGGGVVFGPRGNENYTKRLSKTSKRVALRQALTLANKSKKIDVKEIKSTGKTKEIAEFIKANKLERRIMLVVDDKTNSLIRATSNIQNVKLVNAKYLNVHDILDADHIIFTKKAIEVTVKWLSKEVK